MKTIFRVAGTELRTLFYSPIAWFLMIVFMIQCSICYVGALEGVVRQQEMGGINLNSLGSLTYRIYLGYNGIFNDVMAKLYLYIPLLTMGLISRETSSGSIKLLYSSPVKVREIVFGKYLAMVIYSLVLVTIVGLFVVSGIFHIQHPDTGMLLSAMLGFFLLLCAYSAIGLFMSSLTTYQVIAAVCTFVMIGALSYIGSMWQDIAFVRQLTYFLSISGRTQKMLSGLITTKDVLYFVLIVYIFLGLSIFKLRAGMESKSNLVKAGRYIAVVVSALAIGYLSSIPGLIGYYDATANKSMTLSTQVQQIIKEMKDEPLEVTAYNNLLGTHWYLGAPTTYNMNLDRWERYMRFKPDIDLKTVYYYDSTLDAPYKMKSYKDKTVQEIARQHASSMKLDFRLFKSPEEVRQLVDLRPEFNRFVMQLKWKDRKTFLRIFDDQIVWPTETEVAAAFKRLQQAKMPKVAFLTGDLERDVNRIGDKEYQGLTKLHSFRNSLINQGFDVDSVSLETQDIPSDISTLVVADPKIALSAVTMEKLNRYIAAGGNMLIAGEPGRQAILNPLLSQLGVQLNSGMIVQASKEFSPDLAALTITSAAGSFSRTLKRRAEDSAKVSMPGAAGLSYISGGQFQVEPLLVTDSNSSWNRLQKLDLELAITASAGQAAKPAGEAGSPSQKAIQAGTVTFSPADGDTKGSVPTVLGLTRQVNGKEQRIIVAGDADFMSNAEIQRRNMPTANFVFNTALFSWLSYGEFPIETYRPPSRDNRVNVTGAQVDWLRIMYSWALPGILLVCSAILLIRRKRK
ncbi:MAG: Gldg family protein [Candidatus Pseudobacter hemicellulosilyticus]|uniref:Gldg family protein n=1 Tax=Candidatus Pseudobacter hemicellulosilyticus TaxID=3121375 RepID=A0AAJ5WR12_9BACT|nr:MAG: Gldg family protein [Pseudobacter sp.]